MLKLMTAILITGLLAGCATTPNVTLSYYPAQWNTVATVTQTVGCNSTKTHLVTLNTPSVTTTYSSNFDKPHKIKIKDLDGVFADSDITMNFTDDGRLKSINQSTTGQGETIIKSAVALATAVAAFASFEAPAGGILPECTIIDTWGVGKPITLSYRATINSATLGKTFALEVAPESKGLYDLLQNLLPKPTVSVSNVSESQSGPSYDAPPAGSSDNVVLLKLQKIGSVSVIISNGADTIGTARIVIPEPGTYPLPIPKAALFGKQTFTVTLSEAGAVTSIGYGKTVGTAGALNALGAIANAETPATKAADLKAQADLIAQQQRIVLCQTKPDQCK